MRLVVVLAFALFSLTLYARTNAQDTAYTPYSWRAGDLALASPASWMPPTEAQAEGTATLTLTPDSTKIDAPRIVLEVIATPTQRPFDYLAERLAAWGISIGAPMQTTLAGLDALQVIAAGALTGGGRGTIRADGSALLIYGMGAGDTSANFERTFDAVAASIALGAYQMPRVPGADGVTYTRMGSEQLALNIAAFGQIAPSATAQDWRYVGRAGEQISLFVTDINRLETLNLRLRLTAPDGTLVGENDTHGGGALYGLFSLYDAALLHTTLPVDGVYSITVESVFGQGVYGIGVNTAQSLAFDASGVTRIHGAIDDVFAAQMWLFAGRAGQVYTFTMIAAEGTTLDPALRLYAPNGRTIAQNDDTGDPSLELNAQLAQVALPEDGLYRLEATRYAGGGSGAYEIVIVATS